jgi:sec-independent protein translocase protein TatC
MKLPFRRKEKARVATPDDTMTLTEHLAELRTRIIRSLLAVVVGVIVLLATYDQVLAFMKRPYDQLCEQKPNLNCELSFLGPLEGFTTRLTICTYGGIILALPVIMWQIWRFVVPALHAKEKRYAIPFILSSVLLFLLGGFVAYFTLTPALDFLISWAGADVKANFQVSKYVSLFGLMVAPQTLLKQWRYATLIIFVIAAVITPSGDPYSMMALAVPMMLFYLISVVIGLLFQRRKRAAEAAT